jgi:hypothetical protein
LRKIPPAQTAIIKTMTTQSQTNTLASPVTRDGAQSRLEAHPLVSETRKPVLSDASPVTTEALDQNFLCAHGGSTLLGGQELNTVNQAPCGNAAIFLAAIRRLQEDPTLAQRLLAQNGCMLAPSQPSHSVYYTGLKREAEEDKDDEDEGEEIFSHPAKKPRIDG